MKQKLLIVVANPYDFERKDPNTGEVKRISGVQYGAYNSHNELIQFSSQKNNHVVHEGRTKFDELKAVEIDLSSRMYGGKIKHVEILEI